MAKLKITELKKSLKELEQKELIQLITDIYKLNTDVQEYLSTKFGGDEIVTELYKKAKKKIEHEFFPDRGTPKMRLVVAKKAITDFNRTTGDTVKVVDLMLFYVEKGTEFTNTYGDIDANFYNSMVSMYNKAAEECDRNEELYSLLNDRLYSCILLSEGIGWGYHDALSEIYYSISWVLEEEEE
jgi:hypothetical protein